MLYLGRPLLRAEPLSRETLNTARSLLGSESPDTAIYSIALAKSDAALGRYSETENLLRGAIAVDMKALGQSPSDDLRDEPPGCHAFGIR